MKRKTKLNLVFVCLVLFFSLFLSGELKAEERYDWEEFEEIYINFVNNEEKNYAKEFLAILPKEGLPQEEIERGKEQLDLIFHNFSKLEARVEKGSLTSFNILFRLKRQTDGAYSQQLSVLIGSLMTEEPENFLLAVEGNFEQIKRFDAILGSLGTEYVDEFEKQKEELKRRLAVLNKVETEEISEPIRELAVCKLEARIQRVEQTLEEIEKQKE